ncbi:unnamed protein product [Linum trigynum]|uniref:Uncharacterized protein n=1 Tax=Linum trigynum TaxID=586398 RepID=A0AAV2DWU9_9ROSI
MANPETLIIMEAEFFRPVRATSFGDILRALGLHDGGAGGCSSAPSAVVSIIALGEIRCALQCFPSFSLFTLASSIASLTVSGLNMHTTE